MKHLFSTILILLSLTCYSQYYYSNKAYIDDYSFPKKISPFGKIRYKGWGNELRAYFATDTSILIIKNIDLTSLKLKGVDTVKGGVSAEWITDIIASKNYDIIISPEKLFIYDRHQKKATTTTIDFDNIHFDRGYQINDSIILLYFDKALHPANGFAGLQMHLFNLHSNKIIKSKQYPSSGIAISHMTINWQVYVNGRIYDIAPFTGEIKVYNANLDFVKKAVLPYKWADKYQNQRIQDSTDSIVNAEWKAINKRIMLYGIDSLKKNYSLLMSPVFSNDFFSAISSTIRKRFEFIEKVIPYNDTVVILIIAKPGEMFAPRDVIFYNPEKNSIEKTINNWRCSPLDNITKLEDYFVVNVINSRYVAPYFHNNAVYYPTMYNMDALRFGTKDSVDTYMFKDAKANLLKWRLLKYNWQ